jgi:UDP-2,3-diacylglucosamine pyrophosphatase LpxH
MHFAIFLFTIPLLTFNVWSQTIVRGPYLQAQSSNTVGIRWNSDTGFIGKVSFGTDLTYLNNSESETTATTTHLVFLKNLLPNTVYYYKIGTSTSTTGILGPDSKYQFLTFPNLGEQKISRIWVLGDSGSGDNNQKSVRDSFTTIVTRESRKADAILMLGDNAYDSGTDSEFQTKLFDIYKEILFNTPLFPTMGNHDSLSNAYLNVFTMPNSTLNIPTNWTDGALSSTQLYYSFNFGEIHFICLDSETSSISSTEGSAPSDSAMVTWLKQDLAATKSQWLIAYWHHPPYTKGSHDSDSLSDSAGKMTNMRKYVLPILEKNGVDLILSGHSHTYERSFLIKGHYGTSNSYNTSIHRVSALSGKESENAAYRKPNGLTNAGTIYAVAGSSGKTEGGGALNHPVMYISLLKLGSMILDISHTKLQARFLRETGAIDDNFTITKGISKSQSKPMLRATPISTAIPKPTSSWTRPKLKINTTPPRSTPTATH